MPLQCTMGGNPEMSSTSLAAHSAAAASIAGTLSHCPAQAAFLSPSGGLDRPISARGSISSCTDTKDLLNCGDAGLGLGHAIDVQTCHFSLVGQLAHFLQRRRIRYRLTDRVAGDEQFINADPP